VVTQVKLSDDTAMH